MTDTPDTAKALTSELRAWIEQSAWREGMSDTDVIGMCEARSKLGEWSAYLPALLSRIETLEGIAAMAQFLCDRLDELDFSRDMEDFANDHASHVDPAHERLKAALVTLAGAGGEEG